MYKLTIKGLMFVQLLHVLFRNVRFSILCIPIQNKSASLKPGRGFRLQSAFILDQRLKIKYM